MVRTKNDHLKNMVDKYRSICVAFDLMGIESMAT